MTMVLANMDPISVSYECIMDAMVQLEVREWNDLLKNFGEPPDIHNMLYVSLKLGKKLN